jgi:hypothetical protein
MKVEAKQRLTAVSGVSELISTLPKLNWRQRKLRKKGRNGHLSATASAQPKPAVERDVPSPATAFNNVFKTASATLARELEWRNCL